MRQLHHHKTGDNGDEAYAIEKKTHRNSNCTNHEAPNGWADRACAMEDRAVERNRIQQIFAARHFDGEGLSRRNIESHGDAIEWCNEHDELGGGETGPRTGSKH